MMLIEALVYCGVLGVVLALATGAFFRVAKASNDLKRNAEDIARAVAAGERWRADIQSATSAPVEYASAEGPAVHIRQRAGGAVYSFAESSG